jgi:hypothetical protein
MMKEIQMPRDGQVLMEDVRIVFRNFQGLEGPYNRAGNREFSVLIDQETASKMYEDGWNIKALKSREEGDPEQPYLTVAVNFRGRPPKVVMITSRGRTQLGEEEVGLLDWADIKTVDLILSPYHWNVNGKTGVKAYLQSAFITIEEDALDLKYAEVPDANPRRGQTPEE